MISYDCYITFRMAEAAISRYLLAAMVRPIAVLALSGARRADVTGFGVPEHHGDSSALPMLVKSGNLSLNKVDIRWMSV